MYLNTEGNLRRFLTISKYSNYKKIKTNESPKEENITNRLYTSYRVYSQSKSNKNIKTKTNQNKRFNLFTKLISRQKEKLNISKFFKSKKNDMYNINLKTEENQPKKISKKETLNISISYKNTSKKNYKTLNYDQGSYGRIMKYFTNKSSNKPMKLDELSQVFIPIRNTLSNEHRKNKKINKNKESIKDKINLYLLDSKDIIVQLYKKNKLNKNINNKNNKDFNGKNEHKNKEQNTINKIINNKEIKIENDINYNNMNTIDNNMEENNNKNSLKVSYQYRIRKINVPSGINFASIQSNNKLFHNLLNKKSKKIRINNYDRIQTDYNLMKK